MSNQNTINKNFSYATATGNTNKMCIVKESSVQSPAPAVATHFPTQLHFVLSELEADGMAHIASWQPHGRCFLVHKPKEFLESVLTK